ncbi:MAG: hypothetical protein KatS3mg090_0358 [Patescibacteria group bacterium]|nr:MAG: hypothetical protein KatS3mg090_0358 [Patescibacteria group bacterium]
MTEQQLVIPPERRLPEFVQVVRVVPLVLVSPNAIPKNSDGLLDLINTPLVRIVLVRKTDSGPSAGSLIFPGGKIEEGETSFQAGLRELYEETGLTVGSLIRIISSRVIRIPDSRYDPRRESFCVVSSPSITTSTYLETAKVSAVTNVSWSELDILRQDPDSNLLDSYKDPRTFEIRALFDSCQTDDSFQTQTDKIFSEIYQIASDYETKVRKSLENKLNSLKARVETSDEFKGISHEYLAYLAVFLEESWNNLPDNFQRPFLFIDILQANEISLNYLVLLLNKELINFASSGNNELRVFYDAFINLLKAPYNETSQINNRSEFGSSFLSYIKSLFEEKISIPDAFWQNTIFDNQTPLNPYDHLRLGAIDCLYESIRKLMNETLFNILGNKVNEQNVALNQVKELRLVNLVVNYLISTFRLNLETDLKNANIQSLVLSAKSIVSLIRKILDRGLDSINEQVNDILRCAIVISEENIRELVLGLIYFIRKLLSDSQIEIIHVKINGMENLWRTILADLKDNPGVSVSGKSKVESKASNPLFRWIKFCIKVNGEVFEIQILPSVDDKNEKISDDLTYKIRSLMSNNGGIPFARLVLPDNKYMELLKILGLYTRQD